jgi:hypothetical protein
MIVKAAFESHSVLIMAVSIMPHHMSLEFASLKSESGMDLKDIKSTYLFLPLSD